MAAEPAFSDYVSRLSSDVWALIIGKVVSGVAEKSDIRLCSARQVCKQQASFLRLRLVCKKFNQVFLEHPQLCRGLYLTRAHSRTALKEDHSLLAWLQRHGSSLQTLALSDLGPKAADLLALLTQDISALRSVFVLRCYQPAVDQLSALGHLATLELALPSGSPETDLTPLQGMASLKVLVLQTGNYIALASPPCLTNLQLGDQAELQWERNCVCVTSLEKLRLSSSKLFLQDNLSEFSALQGFTCLESSLYVKDLPYLMVDFTSQISILPADLVEWGHLKCLDITVASHIPLDLHFLYGLSALQDLSVHSREASMHVTPGLTQLRHLTSLTLLSSCAGLGDNADIYFDSNFYGMNSLQLLHIGCDRFKVDKPFLSMLLLPELAEVIFSSGIPIDEDSFVTFALVAHGLATRTRVHLRVLSAGSLEQLLTLEMAENQSCEHLHKLR